MSSTRNTVGLSVNQKKWIYIAISFAAMMIIKNVTFPSSITIINGAELTATGQEALSVLVLALLLWITEAIPFHFTGILAMALLSVFGVDSFANIVKVGFGNINVIFFIGVFILPVTARSLFYLVLLLQELFFPCGFPIWRLRQC